MNAITVELDEPTAVSLTHLCNRWGVPAIEAVRRAVKEADVAPGQSTPEERLAAFRELQQLMQMTPERAAGWKTAILDARR